MSAFGVCSWSVAAADGPSGDGVAARVLEHVHADHPSIERAEILVREEDGRRHYLYVEEYPDRAAMEADHFTEECQAVWAAVEAVAETGAYVYRRFDALQA